jgi:hypothetical protein
MPPAHHFGSGIGRRVGAGKVHRGSRKRVQRIKWRENTSVEVWIFIVLILLTLILGIPWLIKHPPDDHHHHLANE